MTELQAKHPARRAVLLGIPDLWEIWTRSDPLTPDSWLDRDGDGLSDLYEFWYQTDPRTADTDGDGFSDYFEIDNGMDPLVKDDFAPEEPDTNGNGIIDLWEGSGYLYGFQDSNNDGFDDTYAAQHLVPASAENYDVDAVVYTSRSALLTWGEGEGEGIVLPPCTNLIVRLRLDATQDTYLRLLPAPPGQTAEGLWKARLLVGWSVRRTQETELARIRAGDGTIVEHDAEDNAVFIGILGQPPPAPPSGADGMQAMAAGGDFGGSLVRWFRRPRITLFGTEGPRCRVHGPVLVVTAGVQRVEPLLRWTVAGSGGEVVGGLVFLPAAYGYDTSDITVTASQTAPYKRVVVSDTMRFTAGQCVLAATNIAGAAWGSSHNPTNASDHLPRTEQGVLSHYTPNCPATTNTLHHLGFDHAKVSTRNLVRIETGDPQDDDTDHCLSTVWSQGGSTNLFTLLDENHLPFKDDLFFTVNGVTNTSGVFAFGDSPRDMRPSIFHVALCSAEESGSATALDRLWLVVYSSVTIDRFSDWNYNNTFLTWTNALPKPFASIVITNIGGVSTPVDPEPGAPGEWGTPHRINSYLHHDAIWEMRSAPVAGGHGHQATYDANGALITEPIAAGTADIVAPYTANDRVRLVSVADHRDMDVLPFVRALQLDGNPVTPVNINRNLTRPCLYKGTRVNQYIIRRPVIPTGTQ